MSGGSAMASDGRSFTFVSAFVSRHSSASSTKVSRACASSGGEEDLKSVWINLVKAAGPSVAEELYGEEIRPQVDEWLSFASTATQDSHNSVSSTSRFRTLDSYLLSRAVLLGFGTSVGLADIATFVSVHDDLAALPKDEQKTYPNLLRWIDLVQNTIDSTHVYEWIPFEKSKFDPPVSSTEPESKKVVSTAQGPSVKKETVSGTTTPPIEPKLSVKDSKVQQDKKGKTDSLAAGKVESEANVKKVAQKEMKEGSPMQKDVGLEILDIRVGIIVSVKKHPTAETLYVEEIDIGEGRPRQVVSGLAKFLTEDEMLNRPVVVLANVKPSKLRDVLSSGLVLCASNEDHSQCEPVIPPKEAAIGERVMVAGYEGKPEAVLNPKKKQWEKLYPDLQTNDTGVACYKGTPLMTSAGTCSSSIAKGTIK